MTERVSEKEFQSQIIDLAHLLGYRIAHFRPAMTAHGWRTPVSADGKGFPDLVLVRPGNCLFIELKVGNARPGLEQTAWIDALREAGQKCYMWYPNDWDEIVEILKCGKAQKR